MNVISLKKRIEKALASFRPRKPRMVLFNCHQDATEEERDRARDKALAEAGLQAYDGPLITLCVEHTDEEP
jgi:hypothetical protein